MDLKNKNNIDGGPTPNKQKNSIVIVYNTNHKQHKSSLTSPENPQRLTQMMNFLKHEAYLFRLGVRLQTRFRTALMKDILRVHTRNYVDIVIKNSKEGGFFGDSTYFTVNTSHVARRAAGAAIEAGRRVVNGSCDFAFATVRPPGHHARRDGFGGYCIYNNSAILARYLQEVKNVKKVLIVDWDAHAANGTMEIFYEDPTVFLISIHRDPRNFYPFKGFAGQVGRGEGLGYTVNLEVPRGSGDGVYKLAMRDMILPMIDEYKPDFIIGCNGFDIHYSDIYTDLNVTANGIYDFISNLARGREGKLALLMEGGYQKNNGRLAAALLNAILQRENPYPEDSDSLQSVTSSEEKAYKVVEAKIQLLRRTLKDVI
ncbi:MAG: histone deacetylase [Thermoplasmata archaeon]|nr:MAG: histone deacetylase [Thermoplasmata archaeon]